MINRKGRRKEKNKHGKRITTSFDNGAMPSIIKVSLVVTSVFAVFYVIAILITNASQVESNVPDNQSVVVTIQYDEILAGETFNMSYEEYYVLFYDFEDSSAGIYRAIATNYKNAHSDVKIHTVDLSKSINSTYVGEIGNFNVSSIEDLKVNGPTLIKINNKANVSYSEGKDAIKNVLSN